MRKRVLSCCLALLMVLTLVPLSAFAAEYGEWSGWSTEQPEQRAGREIDTRRVTVGYNMVTYITRNYNVQREYRSYSIGGNYSAYGVSAAYGEIHYTYYASKESIDAADTCSEGQSGAWRTALCGLSRARTHDRSTAIGTRLSGSSTRSRSGIGTVRNCAG